MFIELSSQAQQEHQVPFGQDDEFDENPYEWVTEWRKEKKKNGLEEKKEEEEEEPI